MAKDESEKQHGPANWQQILTDEFDRESDRACVILGAALLDSALETLLKTKFVPETGTNDSLLDGPTAPLSTFSAKIDLAYRIGLISAKFARDLHLIRKIRNSFAHNITGCSFSDTSVCSRITELTRSHGVLDKRLDWRESLFKGIKGEFQLAVSWMQWYLRSCSDSATAIEAPPLEWGYTYDLKKNAE